MSFLRGTNYKKEIIFYVRDGALAGRKWPMNNSMNFFKRLTAFLLALLLLTSMMGDDFSSLADEGFETLKGMIDDICGDLTNLAQYLRDYLEDSQKANDNSENVFLTTTDGYINLKHLHHQLNPYLLSIRIQLYQHLSSIH